MQDCLIFQDKQGQINEVPLIYLANNNYFRYAIAKPIQSGFIVGVIINGTLITSFNNDDFYRSISNIERFLCANSTNVSFIVPSINYRLEHLEIPFIWEQGNFNYKNNLVISNLDYVINLNLLNNGNQVLEVSMSFQTLPIQDLTLEFYNGYNWESTGQVSVETTDHTFVFNPVPSYVYRFKSSDGVALSKYFIIEYNSENQPVLRFEQL